MSQQKKIGILGCGWLGLPLAKHMLEKGFFVSGSTTSASKLNLLQAAGVKPWLIQLEKDRIKGDIHNFLKTDILVIDFPPKRKEGVANYFPGQVRQLIAALEQSPVKNVIFISSTSVYPNNNSAVDELTLIDPEKGSGKALAEAENFLLSNSKFETTVIRFAGLVGPDRHPGRFLAGKTGLTGASNPVNLIHLNDCIGIISAVINHNAWGKIFNGCYPEHPTKIDYYTAAARELHLPIPSFDLEKNSYFKIVNGQKAEEILKYRYRSKI